MNLFRSFELSSSALAKRAILLTGFVACGGSVLGVYGIERGTVTGMQAALIWSGLIFPLITVILIRAAVSVQKIAVLSTMFWAVYLCAGTIISMDGRTEHISALVYLIWFFPLLVFNRLVNEPRAAKYLSTTLMLMPLLSLVGFSLRLTHLFPRSILIFLIAYLLSHLCTGTLLNTVSGYREAYITEREVAKTLKVEAEVLESISDCFFSLDSESRLVYLNDAACVEFAVEREQALGNPLSAVAPRFMSQPMRLGLQAALDRETASGFEAQDADGSCWYQARCFPRNGGVSVYFRNITEAVSQRNELAQANQDLMEQAGLLNAAQDCMIVVDMEQRVVFWNKAAERLYGWCREELYGQTVEQIFYPDPSSTSVFEEAMKTLLEEGEWVGELRPLHKNGDRLMVEAHWTLVRDEQGRPRSVFSISRDISKRKASEEKIHHLAFYDSLTALPNRQLLRERLQKTLGVLRNSAQTGVILIVDLDNFKGLNDTLGHDVGDLLIQQVAKRIHSRIAPGDILARFGGDEFLILMQNLHNSNLEATLRAKILGERIIALFQQTYTLGNYEWNGTASIGIALFDGSLSSVDEVLKRADLALYRAKAHGRNTIRVFDPEMETALASRASLEADLRRAVRYQELRLMYQPQVGPDGTVKGAEALLRWSHPQRGKVMPDRFIPLAEETGLMVPIGKWVLETACAQLIEWAGSPETRDLDLAVNVSVQQFQDPDFVAIVENALQTSGADPGKLKLEITESLIVKERDDTIQKMKALKAHGVRFSLDDFGTGYSCLSQLKHLPLDQMKIDRGFIRDVMNDSKDASIVLTIIELAQHLGLSLVAEGVETEAQREFLMRHGCSDFQGYLFSPALDAPDFLVYNRKLLEQPKVPPAAKPQSPRLQDGNLVSA